VSVCLFVCLSKSPALEEVALVLRFFLRLRSGRRRRGQSGSAAGVSVDGMRSAVLHAGRTGQPHRAACRSTLRLVVVAVSRRCCCCCCRWALDGAAARRRVCLSVERMRSPASPVQRQIQTAHTHARTFWRKTTQVHGTNALLLFLLFFYGL